MATKDDPWATPWQRLGWDHGLWPLVRFYRSMRASTQRGWLDALVAEGQIEVGDGMTLPVAAEVAEQLRGYALSVEEATDGALARLRDEAEANRFCQKLKVDVGVTRTRSADHHQATKPMVAAVGEVARGVCERWSLRFVDNPQGRNVWLTRNHLHVSARRLDGAVSSLVNPFAVWEVKEYWGGGEGKAGGSKMSDAVYECHLVGHELRAFEQKSGTRVHHFVFVDGRGQWSARRSDLRRLLDLEAQGLVDRLFVGRDVETAWEPALERAITEATAR